MDAFDEPIEGILRMRYTVSAYDKTCSMDPYGGDLPPPGKGYERHPYFVDYTGIAPRGSGTAVFSIMDCRLPHSVAKVLAIMPDFVLKKLVRGRVESFSKLMTSWT